MKFSSLFSGLAAAALGALTATAAANEPTTAMYIQPITTIYIQPIGAAAPAPTLLGEVVYNAETLLGEVTTFEFPELPEDTRAVRVGVYDTAAGAWASATSVASVANFAKGYAPHFVLTVEDTYDGGRVVGAALRGVRIDAGQTRDFGPQAVLRAAAPGAQVELNKPVVLSPEGKLAPEEQSKTFIQKYVVQSPPSLLFPIVGASLPATVAHAFAGTGGSLRSCSCSLWRAVAARKGASSHTVRNAMVSVIQPLSVSWVGGFTEPTRIVTILRYRLRCGGPRLLHVPA